ncbi:MAG: efflux RND transporter permease subunit [Methylophilus sp.]|nr:efflux RND transporter permease subunit [Methylophilus sp.]
MFNVVGIALKRPYTFVVMALLILIAGILSAMRSPVDIFPEIRIPVVAVAWQFAGLSPDEMAGRITTLYQRSLTTTVNNIEHIEANSYTGFGIVKIFFQPGVDIATANAQVTAISQVVTRQMPAGTTPPLIMNYNASTVPILQIALSGKGLTEQNLADLGLNAVRIRLVTVPGAGVPFPFGGKSRQIQIDLDPAAIQARGLSAQDISSALAAHNLILPVGTQKIGSIEYTLNLNNSATAIEDLANLPVKVVDGATVYIRDVAQVRDGNPPQTNIVHVDGARSVLMTILKNGETSTLSIVSGIKDKLKEIKPNLPENLVATPINDQSLFVRAAIKGVVFEGVLAAILTSLMVLLFLGSWRSSLIIASSIPLSILGAIIALSVAGETLNIMTLGGLALAVGILVDEATVTIENINWHLEQGKEVETAILDGAAQIVTPAFVSLLCICIVFVPMFFLEGVSRFLFVPMAEAVIFAMICSFILSRTLVPTMANYLLKKHDAETVEHSNETTVPRSKNPLVNFQRGFEAHFERLRLGYKAILEGAIAQRRVFVIGFLAFIMLSFLLVPFLGQNFFPSVDSGQILMHARTPIGTRIEDTALRFSNIQSAIKTVIPSEEILTIVDNIGIPISSINMTYNNTGLIGAQDGDIQIALKEGHAPTAEYVKKLREVLPKQFPDTVFSFPPADIVSQILNFGSPAPIDLQIRGGKLNDNFDYANHLLSKIRLIPGVADARIQQSRSKPEFDISIDRTRSQQLGISTRDITNSLVINMAGSSQVSPTFWLNPESGVSYPIVLQTPQYQMDSLNALANLPMNSPGGNSQTLGALATFKRGSGNAVVSQYDIQSMVQINATTQGRDLGAVAKEIRKIIAETADQVPKGATVALLGQVKTMESAFSGLLFGLLGAIVLVYLLIVVNFQSWSDPFVIVTALPAALAGIVWMLFTTYTPLSVPALTGAIMCMGVATANSVLVVSFARERLEQLGDATAAAIDAGFVRFRPVLMTALAMMIGMTPMALGLGEGGEQNAPLGRAVIGGLMFATIATLFFVPVVFSMVHIGFQKQTKAIATGEFHAV